MQNHPNIGGTIPSNLWCQPYPLWIDFVDDGFDEQTLPSCFSNTKPLLRSLSLSNSNFIGS